MVEPVDLGDGADGAARRGRVGTSRKGPRKAGGPISDVDDVEGLF